MYLDIYLLFLLNKYEIILVMYIERIPNSNSTPAVLLHESCREDGKVSKRTLANVSKLPSEKVDDLKILLKGGKAVEDFF